MPQRKSPPPGKPGTRKPSGSGTPSGARKPTGSTRPGGTSGTATRTAPPRGAGARGPAQKPPARRKGKSIVNQRQTPWGLIASAGAVVVFAIAVISYVIVSNHSGTSAAASGGCTSQKMIGSNKVTYLNELQCAADIKGVTFKQEPNRNHVGGTVDYDATPPVGGNHSPVWGDCSGTVYDQPIANENAVHMLEHGAIWITYNAKTLPTSQLAKLETDVSGVDRMALSPYPDLKTPISLQAWGYQLFVNNASDPRIAEFIAALKYNKLTTPEYGAVCDNAAFKKNPSTFGHPTEA